MSDEDFAFWSENAMWLNSQQIQMQQAKVLNGMTAALGG